MRFKLFLLIISFVLLTSIIASCGILNKELVVSSKLLTTEKTFPIHFHERSEQGVLVYKVTNQEAFDEHWDYFRLSGNPTNIDWDKKVAIFLGMYESGSCPVEFKNADLSADKTELNIHLQLKTQKRACTDDATPRTIVLAFDTKQVSTVSYLTINTIYGTTTRVKLVFVT